MKKHRGLLITVPAVCILALIAFFLFTPQCVQKAENGAYRLILPVSGKAVSIPEDYKPHILCINDSMVRNAEEKIEKDIAEYEENSGYCLSLDTEGYLCLGVEVIVNIATESDVSGCGVSHEHLYFRYPISTKAISLS